MSFFQKLLLSVFLFSGALQNALAVEAVSSVNFDTEVLDASASQPVFAIFTAVWCRPCTNFIGKAESAASGTGAKLVTVDVDSNSDLAKQFSINSVPVMLTFKNGKMVETTAGDQSESGLQQTFAQAGSSSAPENDPPKVKVINKTGQKLCYHPMGNASGSCDSREERVYRLPIKFPSTYPSGTFKTRQLMIVAGGGWKVTVPSNGWTTYEGMTFCTKRTFDHESGTVEWVIESATGIEDGCKPNGYRQ